MAIGSDGLPESDEDKRWLIGRIDALLKNMEDVWKLDRDGFRSLKGGMVDRIANWRNNVWVVVSSLITILLSLFAVGLVDRPIVIDTLLLLVIVPLGLTVVLNLLKGFIEDRFGRVDDAYGEGFESILQIRARSTYGRLTYTRPLSTGSASSTSSPVWLSPLSMRPSFASTPHPSARASVADNEQS